MTLPPATLPSVTATDAARELLAGIAARHGAVVLHQSAGCCDGSVPMCWPAGDYVPGPQDVTLAVIDGAPFMMNATLAQAWAGGEIVLDAAPGRGSGFSLDGGLGVRFVTIARTCPRAEG